MQDQASTPRTGGFTDVARALSTPQRVVTRQQVHVWWSRRDRNGFPEGVQEAARPGTRCVGKHVFTFAEVTDWYASYRPSQGGRPRKSGT